MKSEYNYIKMQKLYAYILFILYTFLTYYILIGDCKFVAKIIITAIYISTVCKICWGDTEYNYIERYSKKIKNIKIYNIAVIIITTSIFIIKSILIIALSYIK